ncbi:hypothetical protein Gotur_029926 [Gossypium turneri]
MGWLRDTFWIRMMIQRSRKNSISSGIHSLDNWRLSDARLVMEPRTSKIVAKTR